LAISPAFLSKTLTVQQPPSAPKPHFVESLSYDAEVERRFAGYRSSQSATLSFARKIAVARSSVSRCFAGVNGAAAACETRASPAIATTTPQMRLSGFSGTTRACCR
jgi:hypothetical protein